MTVVDVSAQLEAGIGCVPTQNRFVVYISTERYLLLAYENFDDFYEGFIIDVTPIQLAPSFKKFGHEH